MTTNSNFQVPDTPDWSLLGNEGTNPDAGNFLGTTDDAPLAIKTNDVERIRVTEDGDVGIGTSDPCATLDVDGDFIRRNISDLSSFPLDGDIGTAAATVDATSSIAISQTAANRTLTLPDPTCDIMGRRFTVVNKGGDSFEMHGATVLPGRGVEYVWGGDQWRPLVSLISACDRRAEVNFDPFYSAPGVPSNGTVHSISPTELDTTYYVKTPLGSAAGEPVYRYLANVNILAVPAEIDCPGDLTIKALPNESEYIVEVSSPAGIDGAPGTTIALQQTTVFGTVTGESVTLRYHRADATWRVV